MAQYTSCPRCGNVQEQHVTGVSVSVKICCNGHVHCGVCERGYGDNCNCPACGEVGRWLGFIKNEKKDDQDIHSD